jgi:3-methyladenine DNA glycosylase AlkD
MTFCCGYAVRPALSPGNDAAVQRSREQLKRDLASVADSERARSSAWFFKTGKGEYAEGDRFLGIPVPLQRKIALRYRTLSLRDLAHLLASPIHEHRFAALEILVAQYEAGSEAQREKIFDFFLRHSARVNNWDLVDTSAPYIVGEHLRTRPRDVLYKLAESALVWERRIAIVSTLTFIRHGETEDTFRIAETLLPDKHDLIRKASGWALREAGKVSRPALLSFIERHYGRISRTTLRYAIEHFPPEQRKQILTRRP